MAGESLQAEAGCPVKADVFRAAAQRRESSVKVQKDGCVLGGP